MDIDPKIIEMLEFVFSYAGHIDDFLIIKKELLSILNSDMRRLFSTRHPLTKKQQTNDFERELAKRWEQMSGRTILFKR